VPNDLAERDYKGLEDEAEEAMLRKLGNDGLMAAARQTLTFTQEHRAALTELVDDKSA
jgi:hypothetical protein